MNRDGWIVTAGHIIQQWEALIQGEQRRRDWERQRAAIENDPSLNQYEKRTRKKALPRYRKDDTDRGAAWWGRDGVQLVNAARIDAADVGIGLLQPFDPTWCSEFPIFKDPTKEFQPGASLCTLGFPFHYIAPQWDATALAFRLPPDALPVPFFPMSGIFARTAELVPLDQHGNRVPLAFPLRWIETSSPGLRGQSGGPIFDPEGSIWGIQSNTVHYPLGFDPPVPGQQGKTEHQFLNCGRGVHPETIFGLFNQLGVQFAVSNH